MGASPNAGRAMESFISAADARTRDMAQQNTVPALICSRCKRPVATADELLRDKVQALNGSVWSYELDLLETSAFCYSATNPDDHRFDVARFDVSVCKRLRYQGTPEVAHSWFPPYGWVNAKCENCPSQLGWVFHDDAGAPQFAGIIVTNLVERRVPANWASIPATVQPPSEHENLRDPLLAILV